MRESEILELKTSTSELKEAIISIVAILNKHQRGELYFGVKNDGTMVGQTVTENTIRQISQTISENIEPKIFPKINEVILEGKNCVHVEFSGDNVPYFAYGRAYVRVGDEDKKISSQELEKMILKKNRILWEEEISEKNLKDVNEETLRDFVERANGAKRIDFRFTNAKAVLNKLGLLKDGKLLKAAEVLFCDENKQEVQAAVFAGTDKLTFLDIRQFKGNIFQLLQQSESYLKEHINWRAELKERVRKEIPEIPIRAITEALVNSLCHRDYENRKGNEVAIFKDRVEIYNPGLFPDGYDPKDFFTGTERSILRNPFIANTLYLSKDIERWGSGIKRIHDVCKEEKVKVEFKKLKSGFLVVFDRKFGVMDGVKFGEGSEKSSEKILALIKENKSISAREMAQIIGISQRAVEKQLAILRKEKRIKRVGGAKGGHWEASAT
ncbi:MAG: transcriptional regulator [Candidatus Portnoybacteria bacterium CG10_big_fil_rev_8_21_14_0_10_36_7]|uniref:Transcriptional regulator n=1 Tax=Candidatus Portnoybacteria bacterium CG10_big_fil_rev_8_21_14_0_10_36_7 TaxID=1974812 RepID=A0A2M8KDZ7_9BACT|nr:MAG: transcriptional regulator [Candidatus Portnoybacteria bacterium CG10_big_fil_rev_8_21_14_0_10_36_7]